MTLIQKSLALGLSIFLCTLTSLAAELCNVARNKCIARMGCSMALHNYINNCGPVIHGETDVCTPDCRKALISLFSTGDQAGEMFMTCDCDGNAFCEESKQRIEICSKDVIQAVKSIDDNETMLSCSLASMICEADTSCCTALDYYQRHCKKMWAGEKCTHKCNNSIQILYRQPKAKKLRSCYCDGTERYDCPQLQYNTNFLCFGRQHHKHHHNYNHDGDRDTATENDVDNNDDFKSGITEKDDQKGSGSSSTHINLYIASLLAVLSYYTFVH